MQSKTAIPANENKPDYYKAKARVYLDREISLAKVGRV